jgi:hypothetical protein
MECLCKPKRVTDKNINLTMYNQPTTSQRTGLEFGINTRALTQHKQQSADDDSRRDKQAQAQHECHIYRLGFKMGQVLGSHMRRVERRRRGLDHQQMGIGERHRQGWRFGWKQISVLGGDGDWVGMFFKDHHPRRGWEVGIDLGRGCWLIDSRGWQG